MPRKAVRKKHLVTYALHGGIMAICTCAAFALFSLIMKFPTILRVRGDAFEYTYIADWFTSLHQAFVYTGSRTYGYPLFLYIVKCFIGTRDMDIWARAIADTQFFLHIIACLLFYAVPLKKLIRDARLPDILAPIAAGFLICCPSLVGYTATPLTDTFSTDLLMITVTIWMSIENKLNAKLLVLSSLAGLLLGYSILVRPSFWPPTAVFFIAAFYEAVKSKDARVFQLTKTSIAAMGTLSLIIPCMINVWYAQGSFGLQNGRFLQTSIEMSMQSGLSAVRVYWPDNFVSTVMLPGVRDPFLDETYAQQCTIKTLPELAGCLFSHPLAAPVYFVKKAIALFDEPFLESYAVNATPGWFAPLERIFGTLAFCGFVSLALMTIQRPMLTSSRPPAWIGLPWAAFILTLMLEHMTLHIEGRYGFPAMPFSIISLFLGYAAARNAGGRIYKFWILAMIFCAAAFIYQVCAWDQVPII